MCSCSATLYSSGSPECPRWEACEGCCCWDSKNSTRFTVNYLHPTGLTDPDKSSILIHTYKQRENFCFYVERFLGEGKTGNGDKGSVRGGVVKGKFLCVPELELSTSVDDTGHPSAGKCQPGFEWGFGLSEQVDLATRGMVLEIKEKLLWEAIKGTGQGSQDFLN